MKKTFTIIAIAFITLQSTAQIYGSLSGGAQVGSSQFLMSQELSSDGTKVTNNYGSFGEGMNTQLRLGYDFNQTFGIEMGLGYLIGADQVKDYNKNYLTLNPQLGNSTVSVSEVAKVKAYGRAYGVTLALVYNFNNHIYGKFGGVTKVGGYTMAEANSVVTVKMAEAYGSIPSGTTLKTVTTDLKQEFHGRIPVGFIGALGYKYHVSENLSLFAELEYLGINVTRDNSKYTEFNQVTVASSGTTTITLDQLPTSLKEYEYVDSLPVGYTNTDPDSPTKQLSEVSPYSSFGLNIGITYKFGK